MIAPLIYGRKRAGDEKRAIGRTGRFCGRIRPNAIFARMVCGIRRPPASRNAQLSAFDAAEDRFARNSFGPGHLRPQRSEFTCAYSPKDDQAPMGEKSASSRNLAQYHAQYDPEANRSCEQRGQTSSGEVELRCDTLGTHAAPV